VRRVSQQQQQQQQSVREEIITISGSDIKKNTTFPVNLPQFG